MRLLQSSLRAGNEDLAPNAGQQPQAALCTSRCEQGNAERPLPPSRRTDKTARRGVEAIRLALVEMGWYPREPSDPNYGIDLLAESASTSVNAVVCLASSRTYLVGRSRSLFREKQARARHRRGRLRLVPSEHERGLCSNARSLARVSWSRTAE
jgi:hypothetical protein